MKKIKYILLSLSIVSIIYGCEDFLETDYPNDQIDQSFVFNDERLATGAAVSIYSNLRQNGFLSGNSSGVGLLLGCYTDELEVVTPQVSDPKLFFDNNVLANTAAVNALWSSAYKHIYACNNVIEGLEKSDKIGANVKSQLIGEMLTIRALLHFYLTQTYGEVPIVHTTDYSVNKDIVKSSMNDVMAFVQNDLLEAEQLLSDAYPSNNRTRINKSVAQSLLARVYLYNQNWELALNTSENMLSNTSYILEEINDTFLKESREAIWQLGPYVEGQNTLEASTYHFQSVPAPISRISNPLLHAFDSLDLRKDNWLQSLADDPTNTYSFKYKFRGNTGQSKEYSIIIRLAELYLIAAESAYQLGLWTKGNEYLNVIRQRAGLPIINITNLSSAKEQILLERRKELFCEFGHRFYDIKRHNKWDLLTNSKSNWKPNNSLLPIPERELLLNPNLLPQNNGY